MDVTSRFRMSAAWPRVREHLVREWRAVLLILLSPLLLFPTRAPVLATAVVGIYLVVRCVLWLLSRGRDGLVPSTPVTALLWMLLVLVCAGAWVAPYPAHALPKLGGVLLGMLTFEAVVGPSTQARGRIEALVALYIVAGLVLACAGLLSVTWTDKVGWLARFTAWIPRPIAGVPGAERGAHPNALGALTLFFLPLVSAMASWRRSFRSDPAEPSMIGRPPGACVGRTQGSAPTRWGSLALLGAAIAVLTAVLVLSQSRTAWASAGLTLTVLAVLRHRRGGPPCPPNTQTRSRRLVVLVLGVALVIVATVVTGLLASAYRADTGVGPYGSGALASWDDRLELWQHAVYAIQDFPWTGVGLGSFREVGHVFYPFFRLPPAFDYAHAHNVFLQTALDVGLPGLAVYLAVLIAASLIAWQVYVAGPTYRSALAAGLWGNLLAVHVFGLADAVPLGAKIGIFFWFDLGVLVALHREPLRTRNLTDRVKFPGSHVTAAGRDRVEGPPERPASAETPA